MSTTTSTQALKEGLRIARHLFAKRGDHTEAHLTEQELAVLLTYAFQEGAQWGVRQASLYPVQT